MNLDTLNQLLNLPEIPPRGLIIALDFGLRRIGAAVGQLLTKTATPLKPIAALDGLPEWRSLDACLAEWEPNVLVVGIPLQLDGSPQWITEQTLKFIARLQERYTQPIYGVEEALTSVAAESLRSLTEDPFLRRQSLDSLSAKIMLESWFAAIGRANPDSKDV
jgi:putative holliday junction resolvase